MTDTNTAAAPVVNAPAVERSGIVKKLSQMSFGKKSKLVGHKFFSPEITEEHFDEDSKWIGLGNIVDITNAWLRRTFMDIYIDNLKDDGTFNADAAQADYADFTAGVATLSDLNESIDSLSELQSAYVSDPQYAFGEEDAEGKATEKACETANNLKAVAAKLKVLRAKKAAIKDEYQKRAELRDARKAAKEAVAA